MQVSGVKKKTKLTLSRKDGESISIGDDVTITLHRQGGRTRVVVEADPSTRIMRSELLQAK
jgi:carbon storage regulator CsrA